MSTTTETTSSKISIGTLWRDGLTDNAINSIDQWFGQRDTSWVDRII